MRAGKRLTYPALVGLPSKTVNGAVDATGVDELAPFVSVRLNVAAVDADCRRAEEAEPLRIGWRLHVNESHLGLDPEVGGNTLDKFACTLMVRTVLEVKDLYQRRAQRRRG